MLAPGRQGAVTAAQARTAEGAAISVLAVLGVFVLAVVGAVPALAGPLLDQVGEALRRDPVYVDPAAERKISEDEADGLRSRIRQAERPIFVAVLPAAVNGEVGDDPSRLPTALSEAARLRGTYAVVAGNSFRAGGNALPPGLVQAAATSAFQRRRDDGPSAVLEEFVERVQDVGRPAPDGGGRDPVGDGDGSSGNPAGVLVALVLLGAGGVGAWALWRRRKREREAVQARESLRPEVQLLADDVLALEPEVTLHPEARSDYDAAVNRYRAAEAAVGNVRTTADAERVRRVLAEGHYAMARARARAQGRPPPPPPPELSSPGPNREPAVVVDERGDPAYAGYGGGWYGGGWFGGDLLTGVLIGQALGGGWGFGGGFHHDHHGDHEGGDGGGDGGGDSGGDFGGGDFGGGDFGGGDFGGGDFGGGGDW